MTHSRVRGGDQFGDIKRTANIMKSRALLAFPHLSIQEAIQDGNNKPLQERQAVRGRVTVEKRAAESTAGEMLQIFFYE